MKARLLLLTLAALACGCAKPSSSPSQARSLTERERDSVLARQPLPGASVVGRALEVSDTHTDRSAAVDSLGQ